MKIQIDNMYIVTFDRNGELVVYNKLCITKEEADLIAKDLPKSKVHSNIFINSLIK